jgi:hypothetical protein
MPPLRTPAPRPLRAVATVVLALVLALVAGCGVRLETPAPAPLVPDADESARQRTSADSVALQVLAAAPTPPPDSPADTAADPVAAARAAVAAEASTHLDLLGGLYDAGPGVKPGASPGTSSGTSQDRPQTPAATPEPTPVAAAPDALLTALVEAAATARADTAAVTDGPLARLLGSIAVSRQLSAGRLGAAAGLAAPPSPTTSVPPTLPDGLTDADLSSLVVAEDAAGYGYEVIAAKHADDLRARAGDRARTHRARAQAWAELGEVDGTGLDPRRVAYTVPGGLDDPAAAASLAQSLETTLATHYAALLVDVAPQDRPALVDATAEATANALAWGAALPTLPGLPEQAAG